MDRNTAPSQQPQPRKIMIGSRPLRREVLTGGVKRDTASAVCAPKTSAERDMETVRRRTAIRAIKLYPPFRDCETASGSGRILARARKTSRMKEEKEVQQPQKPVVRPM